MLGRNRRKPAGPGSAAAAAEAPSVSKKVLKVRTNGGTTSEPFYVSDTFFLGYMSYQYFILRSVAEEFKKSRPRGQVGAVQMAGVVRTLLKKMEPMEKQETCESERSLDVEE